MGGASFQKSGNGSNTSVVFALTEGVGALAKALKVFKVSSVGVPDISKFWREIR